MPSLVDLLKLNLRFTIRISYMSGECSDNKNQLEVQHVLISISFLLISSAWLVCIVIIENM